LKRSAPATPGTILNLCAGWQTKEEGGMAKMLLSTFFIFNSMTEESAMRN
jgi:hypothetical protein